MSWLEDRVKDVLSNSWFATMAIRHCGKNYGSERRNQYFFYRKVYRMEASAALREVNKFRANLHIS